MANIGENLRLVRSEIDAAAIKAGRDPKSVTLIAVSKMNPAEAILEAGQCGQTVFGENKVQELLEKQAVIKEPFEWHLIGHLQTNKVRQVVGKVSMIHSVDTVKLAETIDKESKRIGIVTDILLEINIGAEESKFGIAPDSLSDFVDRIKELKYIRIKGLMTVAPICEKAEDNRVYFKKMKELYVDISSKENDNIDMSVLSMGMSSDYEIAIEEGATHVRVGTAIFGARNYSVNQ